MTALKIYIIALKKIIRLHSVGYNLMHDIKHTNNTVITVDLSCVYYNLIIRQSAEFKQFLGWYRQY